VAAGFIEVGFIAPGFIAPGFVVADDRFVDEIAAAGLGALPPARA
jgi:hypothetical protein